MDFSGMFLGELMDGLVNFYRHSNDQKVAINLKSDDKVAITAENGGKKTAKFKKMIVEYLAEHGIIIPNGANKNRTYSLKK